MNRRHMRNGRAFITRQCASVLLVLAGLLLLAPASRAQLATLGPVTIGAGLQTGYFHTETDGAPTTDQIELDHARIYINGSVTGRSQTGQYNSTVLGIPPLWNAGGGASRASTRHRPTANRCTILALIVLFHFVVFPKGLGVL